jgi:sugar lactone lactonase YvrE
MNRKNCSSIDANRLRSNGWSIRGFAVLTGFASLGAVAISRAEPKPEVIANATGGLVNPFGVAFDSKDRVYIVEYLGGRIFRLESDGRLEHFAGKAEKGFAGDGGPARDALFNGMHNAVCTADDQLYISDTRSNRIRKIDLASGLIETIAGSGKPGIEGDDGPAMAARLNDPISIALDRKSNALLIADINNRRIRSIDLEAGTIRTLAGTGEKGVPKDGALAANSPLFDPRACDVDSKGNLYILERGGHALRVIGTDGRIKTVAGTGKAGSEDGPALKAGLKGPKHLCVDDRDRVIIADAENHLIRLYDPKDGSIKTILGRDTKLNRPHGVTVHGGWLYIADSWNDRVLRMKW